MGVELNYNYGDTNHMAEENQYSGEVIQAGLEKTAKDLASISAPALRVKI